MNTRFFFLISFFLFGALQAEAKIKVVTTVPDLRAIAEKIGGDQITVESIAKGSQDPHFIDAKPSYMTKLSNADLLISIGLGLEDAWLNGVIRGARNPSLNRGQKGSLVVGPLLNPEEIPTEAELTRKEGDVHPEGNPHVTLDPVRVQKITHLVADKLSELDSANQALYQKRASEYEKFINDKTDVWKKRVHASGVKNLITYHKTLNYFIKRMNLNLVTQLEPKPGIAPSAPYLSQVVEQMKNLKVSVVLIENYFDPTVGKKLKELNPAVKVAVVPVSVDGMDGVRSMEDLFEHLVKTIEGMK